MTATLAARALIAEDEALLAAALSAGLQRLWPELAIVGVAANGIEAVEQALATLPDILFFDIKMPGNSGLEAARELADEWPDQRPFPLLVFVTAYDDYAVQAFEQAAIDYVLKPANDERLAKTVERLQARLAQNSRSGNPDSNMERVLQQLRGISANLAPTLAPAAQERLRTIRAAVGNQIKLIPIEEVIYFEATDKYVNVVTADSESLIRTSLKELIPQLDPDQFWQIHRGTVVRIAQVQSAQRDEAGKWSLRLRTRPETLTVSRLFAHLFRQM
ncbi:LytR/AlgR family response regulator transcription factor [Herbaspirillum rhizosphaerae]|uniref:LytR/AlgR family response regulator transcription factor n=1 Tax=Herbaspirillum rhizosphaerae TaxID=346179 RepID=UPI00067B025C|nr:LytTR family DNA-binding domain-containing protein [Herbaspirillum rhizosphaerae]